MVRRIRALIVGAFAALAIAGLCTVIAHHARARTARIERDLGALQACLVGGPIAPPETTHARIEALSASMNTPEGAEPSELERSWPASCQPMADALLQSVRSGVPSSWAGRGAALADALSPPVAIELFCPFGAEPSYMTDPHFALRAEAECESGTQVLSAWWARVEAGAGAAGFVARDDASFAGPGVRRPALTAPFPEPVDGPFHSYLWASRTAGQRQDYEGFTVFRALASGRARVVKSPSKDAVQVLSADDDAPSLIWRRGARESRDAAVIDERGIEVWPRGVRTFGAHATRAGVQIVLCPPKQECRLIERGLRGDAYVTLREQRIPGSTEAQLHGGVLLVRGHDWLDFRLSAPGDPFGRTEALRYPERVAWPENVLACRHGDRTALLFAGEPEPIIVFHDGHAWSTPIRGARLPVGGHPSISCDATGATLVGVGLDQRVCEVRCLPESCTTTCSAPLPAKWAEASWVGVGDHVLGVGAETSTHPSYVARNSVWYRFGTIADLGEDKLLVAGALHHSLFGKSAHAWPVEDGAVVFFRGPDALTRFARVDVKGEFSFVGGR